MAKKFTNIRTITGEPVAPVEYDVDAGAVATIATGNPLADNSGYVTNVSTGATSMVGIAAGPSDETATADGKVNVYQAPWLRFNAVATTPANLAQTTKTTTVTIDVATADFTVDENDTSSGFVRIVDYDNTTDGNCDCIAACTL